MTSEPTVSEPEAHHDPNTGASTDPESKPIPIWFTPDRTQFFAIPAHVQLPQGALRLRGLQGVVRRVDAAAVAPYAISKDQATAHIGAAIDQAWARARQAFAALIAAGKGIAGEQGVHPTEQALHHPLPSDLSEQLGVSPGELYTDPDAPKRMLNHLVERFSKGTARAKSQASDPPPTAGGGFDRARDALNEAAESPSEALLALGTKLRGVLESPELHNALTGLGRAMYTLSDQLKAVAKPNAMLERAQGCLLGQLAGDALGSLVEFEHPEAIVRNHPGGVRQLVDGGTWNTLAGQPTDDSEMALALARGLVAWGTYDAKRARAAYVHWIDSNPFDCGTTVAAGLKGHPNPDSQANGALMRISPLGMMGAHHPLPQVAEWAQQDAALTHPHPVCQQANALFAMAIAHAIATGASPERLYQHIVDWAIERSVDPSLLALIRAAASSPPADYVRQQGWVRIAFQNALWQLLHAPNLEQGVVDTVMRGGDTDTNAAICGALLGAVHGLDAVPEQWVQAVLNCRPMAGRPGVHRPRPEQFWPVDALELAKQLLAVGAE